MRGSMASILLAFLSQAHTKGPLAIDDLDPASSRHGLIHKAVEAWPSLNADRDDMTLMKTRMVMRHGTAYIRPRFTGERSAFRMPWPTFPDPRSLFSISDSMHSLDSKHRFSPITRADEAVGMAAPGAGPSDMKLQLEALEQLASELGALITEATVQSKAAKFNAQNAAELAATRAATAAAYDNPKLTAFVEAANALSAKAAASAERAEAKAAATESKVREGVERCRAAAEVAASASPEDEKIQIAAAAVKKEADIVEQMASVKIEDSGASAASLSASGAEKIEASLAAERAAAIAERAEEAATMTEEKIKAAVSKIEAAVAAGAQTSELFAGTFPKVVNISTAVTAVLIGILLSFTFTFVICRSGKLAGSQPLMDNDFQ
eukprot:gnl/MRDRNA2_/MRDRNA2_36392_c0_seq1.p1 gnl/MRDRNA2_/MRDRNA2_36392_c0~~gnl/MRDRNA2_/MRDRNA2_36392_c0_seq1.p1  ORF type:complete len:380 (-),score=108.43 gnl/MRDRNA2_/MRDRNA2_36392_c0_seq1:141-1280(-)